MEVNSFTSTEPVRVYTPLHHVLTPVWNPEGHCFISRTRGSIHVSPPSPLTPPQLSEFADHFPSALLPHPWETPAAKFVQSIGCLLYNSPGHESPMPRSATSQTGVTSLAAFRLSSSRCQIMRPRRWSRNFSWEMWHTLLFQELLFRNHLADMSRTVPGNDPTMPAWRMIMVASLLQMSIKAKKENTGMTCSLICFQLPCTALQRPSLLTFQNKD